MIELLLQHEYYFRISTILIVDYINRFPFQVAPDIINGNIHEAFPGCYISDRVDFQLHLP